MQGHPIRPFVATQLAGILKTCWWRLSLHVIICGIWACARPLELSFVSYEDASEGVMVEEAVNGVGQFVQVTLRPRVVLAPGSDKQKAELLHHAAHENCFIARSVNFPVIHEPIVEVETTA